MNKEQPSLRETDLPQDLAEYLATQEFACLIEPTEVGSVFVVKAPRAELEQIPMATPILVEHELYATPSAPVLRTVVRVFQSRESQLAFETFTNVADDWQRQAFLGLATQERQLLLFYDEQLQRHTTKQLGAPKPAVIAGILADAHQHLEQMTEPYDFDRAKADVMERTGL